MIEQTYIRFFRYLIDVDGRLTHDYSKIAYNSELDESFFRQFNQKDNVFVITCFCLLWKLCQEYYTKYMSPISDTTLSLSISQGNYTMAQISDLESVLVDVRKFSAEPGQFDSIRDEIRAQYIKNHEVSVFQKGVKLSQEDPLASAKYVQDALAGIIAKTTIGEDPDEQCMFLWQLMEKELEDFRKYGSVMPNALSYGFSEFVMALGGMYPGHLIVACGPPNVGKSFFVSEIGYNAALSQGKRVVIANREMLYKQVVNRFLSRQTQIPSKKLRNGVLLTQEEKAMVEAAMEDFIHRKTTNLFFMPPAKSLSAGMIRKYIENAMGSEKPDLIIVDYLNDLLADNHKGEGHERIGMITQELKSLAIHFRCPVLTPTQPSSAGLDSQNPSMKDVGYKIINQKADTMFFLTEDPEQRYVPPVMETEAGTPGGVFVKVIKARNDGKPPFPFRLEVEFATTSISQSNDRNRFNPLSDDYEL